MKRINKLGLLSVLMLFILLSACSYKEFEDSLKSKLDTEKEDQYVNPSNIPVNDPEVEQTEATASEAELATVGDTITFTFDGGDESHQFQYTLNQAFKSDTINELSLKREDFADPSLINEDGSIDEMYRLVLVDVTVKNINNDSFMSEEDNNQPIMFIESSIGFKEEIEDPNGPFTLQAVYFSEHPPYEKNQWNDYYQFPLSFGQELDAKVGWFVPAEQLEKEPLYYIIGGGGSAEYYKYFELTFD
ncbi:DUF5027 family lipoprotein [Gracilibacillus salinarum]|uniref:DUF4352 domain-containing protein n=1 Tax=Gracilibacillus salinarum TaxID=2932255 RepID=A0ABY4GHP8_9BACI|nr:hypothetical protein [Gracilibacillus salinarum]UOQ83739.1 hypothetical protein MUN87_13345 [Gracilibacillus salinarum]